MKCLEATLHASGMPAYLQAYNPQTVIKDILDELVEAGKDSDVLKASEHSDFM